MCTTVLARPSVEVAGCAVQSIIKIDLTTTVQALERRARRRGRVRAFGEVLPVAVGKALREEAGRLAGPAGRRLTPHGRPRAGHAEVVCQNDCEEEQRGETPPPALRQVPQLSVKLRRQPDRHHGRSPLPPPPPLLLLLPPASATPA